MKRMKNLIIQKSSQKFPHSQKSTSNTKNNKEIFKKKSIKESQLNSSNIVIIYND